MRTKKFIVALCFSFFMFMCSVSTVYAYNTYNQHKLTYGVGNYGKDTVYEDERYASVMDTGAETMRLVYGSLRQGSLTIQLQNQYAKPFDRIRVGQKIYQVDSRRDLRTKQTFVVSEVQ